MSMEKQGVIREGVTPEEQPRTEKTASADQLEDHTTRRLSDAAEKKVECRKACGCSRHQRK